MNTLKETAIKLRKEGKTYGEILNELEKKVAKSTLSNWCHNINLTEDQQARIDKKITDNIENGRKKLLQ